MPETERKFARFAVLLPSDLLGEQLEAGVLRDVADVGEKTVDRVTLRPDLDGFPQQFHGLGEPARHVQRQVFRRDLLGEVVAGEDERAARVLLLGIAEKVGRHAQLGFDLLLAVAEVVVRNNRHHDTVLVARGDLECRAVVVEFVPRFPTHAVAALALAGFVP